MSKFELAQMNIAVMKAPLESPLLADFVANLDPVNALAEQTPGYVWRLQSEEGDATALRPFGEDTIVNMSVWRDLEALKGFMANPTHLQVMRRRGEWFERMEAAYAVLWWVPAGHRPTPEEGKARLDYLRRHGSTPHAFSFRESHAAPDAAAVVSSPPPLDACPA
jgi:hypothetical protein